MSAKIVTITSGKGGVGKTTAIANIAVALASNGAKVCCIDGDIGLRNLDVVMGLENRIVYDIVDVIEGRCRLRQAMIRDKRLPELYLIPAAQTRDKSAVSPSDMVRLGDELRNEVDWVLIDSPAGIERGFRNSIAAADQVLVITNPEVSAVRDADRVIGLLEAEDIGIIGANAIDAHGNAAIFYGAPLGGLQGRVIRAYFGDKRSHRCSKLRETRARFDCRHRSISR